MRSDVGSNGDEWTLKARTKGYALRIFALCDSLPNTSTANLIRGQLSRAGASVGANYRAAMRARSTADFIAKMGIVEEEADESLYWMELLIEAKIMEQALLGKLMQEGNEILAMTVSSIVTAKSKRAR